VTQGAFDGSFDLASSDETPSSRSESVLRGWLPVVGPFTVGASFLLLCIWTWGRWFDPLVDFGRELYVPWRLREGQVLFRDIAWFNGPFSAYFNAALFRVFGTSITTLVVANLTILAAGTALLYLLVRSHASHLTATVTAVVALALFGFGHLSALGNFNFVAPYSHEATHGLVLGAAALAALGRWSAIRRSGWLGLAGALLGLCFLTKGEIFLAAAAGCGVLLAFAWRERDEPAAARARQAGLWLASVALPALASFVLLSFAVQPAPGGGAQLSWSSDPGPEDLAGYRVERTDGGGWRTLAALLRETSYTDVGGAAGARYRLSAVNGLGEELVLGEASLAPARPLAAWPLPYRGGRLDISFATYGGLGGGAGEAEAGIYDVTGRLVRRVARGTFTAGVQSATWDGLNARGERVRSGLYFIRARSADHVRM